MDLTATYRKGSGRDIPEYVLNDAKELLNSENFSIKYLDVMNSDSSIKTFNFNDVVEILNYIDRDDEPFCIWGKLKDGNYFHFEHYIESDILDWIVVGTDKKVIMGLGT